MTKRNQLVKDRLLILEHLSSSNENLKPLIEQCNTLLETNKPSNTEKAMDLLYEQFESSFASGELLEAFSNLIKQTNK